MIKAAFWSVLAVVISLVVALAVAMEGVSAVFHPAPPGMDPNDMEACKAPVANYPQWLLGVVAAAWGLTAFTWEFSRHSTGDETEGWPGGCGKG